MLPEVKSLEARFKQILYGCVEHVQATKAALYLSTTHDLNAKTFEIVTSYQYNPADRKTVTANDDLVDRLVVKRGPFYINGLAADACFAEIMFRQGNDRMLATPLFSRGRMIGFIDMRDKAAKKPFTAEDVDAATKIAEEMMRVLAENELFGLAPIARVEDPAQVASRVAPRTNRAAGRPAQELKAGEVFSAGAAQVIEAARQFMTNRQLAQQSDKKHTLADAEIEAARILLPATLAIPGAEVAVFTAMGHIDNPQIVVAASTLSEEATAKIEAHLEKWLKRTNQVQLALRPHVIYPFGERSQPVALSGPIVSAPVSVPSVDGLVLTVGFRKTPDAQAQRDLHNLLRQIERAIESGIASASGKSDQQTIAEFLIEPDFRKLPELADHSREVSVLAQRFGRILDLPPLQLDTLRIAALVHDVGMRLLDYERLYRRPSLTAEEMRGLAEHPVVGAALVEPLLGVEVAQIVLRHHERFDGKGYPSRLGGNKIPLLSRIIQIADAWVSMTSRMSYQPPITHEEAAQRLRENAGTQFDPTLVERFLRSLTELI